MEKYVDYLYKLCVKAAKNNDVPIAAIVECNGKIIGEGYNTREKDQSILGHAEINAIKMAVSAINNWNLCGCNIYVTLKPCNMCMEIIKQCRISNIYYILDKSDSKLEYNKTCVQKVDNVDASNFKKILSNFFEEMREKC